VAPIAGPVTRLLLVRHGQSEWNAAGRWQGWNDVPLSALGREQAREATPRLGRLGITAIVHSGMLRTALTADIVNETLHLPDPTVECGLKEYDVGEWGGLTRPEIEQRWPGALDQWFNDELPATPNGEVRAAFRRRVLEALHRLQGRHPGGSVLVVTHGGVVGMVQRSLEPAGDGPRIGNLSGRWVEADGLGSLVLGPLVHLLEPEHETTSPTA
jgi:probable phosphoglycerate mutase